MKRTLLAILIALLFIPILPMIAESSINNNLIEQEVPERTAEKSNSSNQTNTSFSSIPNPNNYSRLKETFEARTASNGYMQEYPNMFAYEYTDGKVISIFTEPYLLSNGNPQPPSISMWSYPEQGGMGSFASMSEDLRIPLSTNFSHFGSCNPHIYNSKIYAYCSFYESDSAMLVLDNNNSVYVEQHQDILIQWDVNGSFQSHWIPHVNSSSNQWSSYLRSDYSARYVYQSQFLNDSIYLLIQGASTDVLNFPNGTVSCRDNGICNILTKVNLNGTVQGFITGSQYYGHLNRHHTCSNVDRFSIYNSSAIMVTMSNDDCTLKGPLGNAISYSKPGGNGFFIGFDTGLNFIDSIRESPCSGLTIFDAVILPDKTYYTIRGGDSQECSSVVYNWIPSNITNYIANYLSFVSKFSNGTIDWSYSWYETGSGNHDKYGIFPLSYGIAWSGPNSYSNIDWTDEIDGHMPPYLGPSSSNRAWSPVFTYDGRWVDVFQNRFCSNSGASQGRPIMYQEISTGFGCSFYHGNSWYFETYAIDIDSDNYGHSADAFPFDSSQQYDTDLDGYGDNVFGNNSDECVTVNGNSTLDRLGCLDTDGDGQSNLNDFYPTDPTQVKDSDFDGYGDNLTGTRGDNCPNVYGESNRNNTYGCLDSDFDGWADTQDHFPNQSSQWMDSDLDGYGDEFNGYQGDTCPQEFGLSTEDTYGCEDDDFDGWSNNGDDLPYEPTQWLDADGDGYGNNQSEGASMIDLFPNDATQWNDSDGDGYGDNRYGSEGDKFPNDPLRWEDTDNDGVTDLEDQFPNDITQWNDTDGDGFGDEITGNSGDACPTIEGNSTADRRGCLDSDGDGWSDERDDFPFDRNLYLDTDDDGVPDDLDMFPFDPTQTEDRDGDGMGDNPMGIGADKFPDDTTQWGDIDGDGYGDNAEGTNPDAFITDATQWSDTDGDGYGDNPAGRLYDKFPLNPTQWLDEDGDGLGDNQSGTNADPSLNDFDNDGYNDSIDPLPKLASPDDLDNDGVLDVNDLFPEDFREWADYDGDGEGDNADTDDDNDGWADTDEVRLGTDPFGAADVPIDSFEIVIPGTAVGLGAWDLIGMFGGIPLFMWIGFGFVTRNNRTAKYEGLLREAQSRDELEDVARMWEYSLMLRMLGPHQGIRLERLRAELDDVFEAQNQTLSSIEPEQHDQTQMVEQAMHIEQKSLPSLESTQPEITAQGNPDGKGYEWYTDGQDTSWYRNEGSKSEWQRFEA